jgi:AcrR family transcriptional regulator
MRVSAADKEATRERILLTAAELFRRQGFESTTTRDIAQAAEIAAGTLFNYFDTKEAIVASLAAEVLAKARNSFQRQPAGSGLDEDLFSLTAGELRQLKPLRSFIRPLLETLFSPLAANYDAELRIAHLEIVAAIARRQGVPELPTPSLHLYWSLYLGVLAYWATDKSPRQEDTLALLDESIAMFTAWLRNTTPA